MIASRLRSSDSAAAARWLVLALGFVGGLVCLAARAESHHALPGAQEKTAPQTPISARLLAEAVRAESGGRFDYALDRLQALAIEHPGTPELREGRLSLARLLALNGELIAGIRQCQALHDDPSASDAQRQAATGLATTLARRLRVNAKAPAGLPTGVVISIASAGDRLAPNLARSFFSVAEPFGRGISGLGEPSSIVRDAAGAFIVVDPASKRVYRILGDAVSPVPGATQPLAAAPLPDGSVVVANSSGFSKAGAAVSYSASGRSFSKVRSMSANSQGDLFIIDAGIDGLLRCKSGGTSCAPWAATGKLRNVRVGPSDVVVVSDDRQESIRVFDDGGRPLTTFGPVIGATKIGRIEDFAVDQGFGIYLLDPGGKQVKIVALQSKDGQVSIQEVSTVPLPSDGTPPFRNPTAIGVGADGAMLIADKTSKLTRFR